RRRHTRLVSDWSSDVCSSDLSFTLLSFYRSLQREQRFCSTRSQNFRCLRSLLLENPLSLSSLSSVKVHDCLSSQSFSKAGSARKIGRASCRERVEVVVVERSL